MRWNGNAGIIWEWELGAGSAPWFWGSSFWSLRSLLYEDTLVFIVASIMLRLMEDYFVLKVSTDTLPKNT